MLCIGGDLTMLMFCVIVVLILCDNFLSKSLKGVKPDLFQLVKKKYMIQ